MNIVLARTFLEVVASGNFFTAADRLHVTQSTVSMRIKALEDVLGRKLFERHKSGSELTAAGNQFRLYAEVLVGTWERARQEIVLPAGIEAVLSIGSESHLWDSFLIGWLGEFRDTHKDVAVRAEIGDSSWLTRQLLEGLLDLAITYTPNARSGVVVEPLYEETLVLVSHKARGLMRWSPDYIYTDWGSDIREAHSRAYPEGNRPSLTGSLGALSIRLVLKNGGSGYFPLGSVKPYIDQKQLFIVTGAPVFERKVYCVYHQLSGPKILAAALGDIRAASRRMNGVMTKPARKSRRGARRGQGIEDDA
jgi:LysR family transcriptional regulator, flagellar master operon regulator